MYYNYKDKKGNVQHMEKRSNDIKLKNRIKTVNQSKGDIQKEKKQRIINL